MPWTFAHPVAVLPLRRFCPRYLHFPSLIVGALTPDFGYYIAGAGFATHAHSFSGVVAVCLPTGLLMLGVLCLMRKPLCFVLPQPHRAALAPLADAPITVSVVLLLKIAVSLMLGACTHMVWDAFTHKRDLIGLQMDWLLAPAFQIGATVVPVYYLTQWISTLAGTAILVIAYCRWLRSINTVPRDTVAHEEGWCRRLLIAIAIIALVIAVPIAMEVAARYSGAFSIAVLMRCVAVFGTVAFVVLLGACAAYCYRRGMQ